MTTPIQKAPPLRDQVVEALVRALRSGELQPGERLTELAVAARFGVSRTPAREALNLLVEQGLLESRPGGGYLVPRPTPDLIRDLVGVRMLLEPPAVATLALNHDATDLSRIDAAIEAEWSAVDAATPTFALANEAFRSSLFSGLPNRLHHDIIAQFAGHLNFIRAATLDDLALRRDILARQARVREEIARGDADAAAETWKDYLRFTQTALTAALARIAS